MRANRPESSGKLKVVILAAVAAAIAVGLALPVPHKNPPAKSQFTMLSVSAG